MEVHGTHLFAPISDPLLVIAMKEFLKPNVVESIQLEYVRDVSKRVTDCVSVKGVIIVGYSGRTYIIPFDFYTPSLWEFCSNDHRPFNDRSPGGVVNYDDYERILEALFDSLA